jgi:2-polyprenyl-3-methyl-5-hydroxy-6-metoxy-1,4-benzoquinol methylase
MRFTYNSASLPRLPPGRLRNLLEAADRLGRKISDLDMERLPLSVYGREDVANFQCRVEEVIRKYVHILAWLQFPEYAVVPDVFVDHGGGHGLLACLAKEAGFPCVIYNDVFEGSADDARKLAANLGLTADSYVCGDIHAVAAAMKSEPSKWATLASVNVIEHIYDIGDFIRTACALSSGPMTLALSTSANPLNPLVVRRHRRQHREWEFTDGPHKGSYPMDTLKAFCSVRRDIIRAAVPELSVSEVESLVTATRGMRKTDIENSVLVYRQTTVMPAAPKDPTNTCDPLTGSWQERLLDIDEVRQRFAACGFTLRLIGGYYSGNGSHRTLLKAAAYALNHGISLLGSQGARLAPCVMFHATRR